MKLCIFGSGSKGNSLFIECKGTALLIDQGLAHKELVRRMTLRDMNPSRIIGILVTHEHIDHAKSVGVTARQFDVPVYATRGSIEQIKGKLEESVRLVPIDGGVPFSLGSMKIHPFSISHDAMEPVQFRIEAGKKSITVATDLGFVSTLVAERLKESSLVVIESNYDLEMLKRGSYPWELKQRIMGKRGHLSNVNASEVLFNISRNGAPRAVLAHLSQENNDPAIAEQEVRTLFDKYDKKLGQLIIALQDEPTEVIEL